MTEQEQSKQLVQQITDKLERAIKKGILPHAIGGYLTSTDQHAVRIIRSRIRLLNRIYKATYNLDTTSQIELTLLRQDDGSLISLGDRRHSVGRLGCNACENTYDSGFPRPMARLCPICKGGIQHCIRVVQRGVVQRVMVGVNNGNLPSNPTLGSTIGKGTPPGPGKQEINGITPSGLHPQNGVPGGVVEELRYICDYCGEESKE